MKNFLNDYMFRSFVTSAEIEVDNAGIVQECYALRNASEDDISTAQSWRSNTLNDDTDLTGYTYLHKLYEQAKLLANETLKAHSLECEVKDIEWHVNIDPTYIHNMDHGSPKADLKIMYYAQIPPNGGTLMITRNDGARYSNLYKNKPHGNLFLEIFPEVGRMYVFPAHIQHHITANASEENRICITFNIFI